MDKKDLPLPTEGQTFRYIDPMSDYGFKMIFGDAEVMADFLNDLIKPESPIKRVEFLNKEMLPKDKSGHGVVYDLRCRTTNGDEFIVEMQKWRQSWFADRMLYYMSQIISSDGLSITSDADKRVYNLKNVYGVFLLDFHLKNLKPSPVRTIRLRVDETGDPFSEKMCAYTIELPYFRKKRLPDCRQNIEYWNYMITHMQKTKGELPFTDKKPIFKKVAKLADYSNMSVEDKRKYWLSIEAERTFYAYVDSAKEEGEAKGKAEGKAEVAKSLVTMSDMPDEQIAQITGLTLSEVQALRK